MRNAHRLYFLHPISGRAVLERCWKCSRGRDKYKGNLWVHLPIVHHPGKLFAVICVLVLISFADVVRSPSVRYDIGSFRTNSQKMGVTAASCVFMGISILLAPLPWVFSREFCRSEIVSYWLTFVADYGYKLWPSYL